MVAKCLFYLVWIVLLQRTKSCFNVNFCFKMLKEFLTKIFFQQLPSSVEVHLVSTKLVSSSSHVWPVCMRDQSKRVSCLTPHSHLHLTGGHLWFTVFGATSAATKVANRRRMGLLAVSLPRPARRLKRQTSGKVADKATGFATVYHYSPQTRTIRRQTKLFHYIHK